MSVHPSRVTSALLGAAVMLASATVGHAADLDFMPPPELRPSLPWEGAYAGGLLTGGFLDSSYTPSDAADPELAGDGIMGGFVAGYNWQFNHLVVGIEADASYGKIDAKNSIDEVEYKIPWLATARARLGYAMDDTLIYGTAGVGVMEGRMFLPEFGEKDKKTHLGFVIGGGIEQAFSENLRGRIEYIHGNFENKVYEFTPGTVDLEVDDLHLVRAALVWNFTAD
jgi:outer membrane immunogenic protein